MILFCYLIIIIVIIVNPSNMFRRNAPDKSKWDSKKIQRRAIEMMEELGPRSASLVARELESTFAISERTLRSWKEHFDNYGEIPVITNLYRRKNRSKMLEVDRLGRTEVLILKAIIDKNPEFYLDEFQRALYLKLNHTVSLTTLWRIIHETLNYSLQTLFEVAKEKDEYDRTVFKKALWEVTSDPKQFVFADESAKDRAANRRRRGLFNISYY